MTVKVWRSWPTACGYTSDSQEQLWEGIRYSSWAINLITLVASRHSHYLEFQDLYIFEMDDYMGKFTLRPIIVPWNRPTVSTLTFKLVWWYTFMCSLCEKCYFRVVYKLVWKSFSLAFSNWNGKCHVCWHFPKHSPTICQWPYRCDWKDRFLYLKNHFPN